eukprot:scaffold127867_cov42-Phaeocystis_antarctica.AAC.3
MSSKPSSSSGTAVAAGGVDGWLAPQDVDGCFEELLPSLSHALRAASLSSPSAWSWCDASSFCTAKSNLSPLEAFRYAAASELSLFRFGVVTAASAFFRVLVSKLPEDEAPCRSGESSSLLPAHPIRGGSAATATAAAATATAAAATATVAKGSAAAAMARARAACGHRAYRTSL